MSSEQYNTTYERLIQEGLTVPQLGEIWIRNGETNHTTTVLMVLNDHVLFCINHINNVGNSVLCTSIVDFLANYHLLETEKYYPGNEYNKGKTRDELIIKARNHGLNYGMRLSDSDNKGEESNSS